ncbi:MAG TPA: hypothetical protein VE981_15810 [Planctomycetota bacterium]|nr:hypothetical protein [Planctomycetota bacterium]
MSTPAPADPGALPPLYSRWMRELLKDTVRGEPQSTCDDCAMCPSAGVKPQPNDRYFSPDVKCCTFVPELPNYLVGRILSDADPDGARGRESVRGRLRAGGGVTPLGVATPLMFELIYRGVSGVFGKSRAIRCPHYLEEGGGRCSIWRNRPGVCATWHCKHERGAVGHDFWRALHILLTAVQRALARWCVQDLPAEILSVLFPPIAPSTGGRPRSPEEIDGAASPAYYAAAWGTWKGREEDFYRDCARKVDRLRWSDVRRIGGVELTLLERLLLESWRKLRSDAIPEALRAGSVQVVPLPGGTSRVLSYNENDPIELPSELLDVLGYFDGRPTADALAAIDRERGLVLERDLLRQLVDFQVLVAAR